MTLFGLARGGHYLDLLGSALRQMPGSSTTAWIERRVAYDRYTAYYENRIYDRTADGGQRDAINRALGNAEAVDLDGLYNPIASVVDLYQHVLGGAFAEGPEDQDASTIRIVPGRTAQAAALQAAITQIWHWSNMTMERQPLCRLAANLGTCGLRVVASPSRQRVYLKVEHPGIIQDVELDDRGNVRGIVLEWDEVIGLGADQEPITIREELTKAQFATYRLHAGQAIPYDRQTRQDRGPGAVQPNDLGLVPYVLVQHGYTGEPFGHNAYHRVLPALDRLNALLSHIDIQIHQHVRVNWFVAAPGAGPQEFDLSGQKVIYLNTSIGGGTPVIRPLLADLNLGEATAQARMQLNLIENMLPELKAVSGTFLSGISGQTVSELRKPAEDALLLARTNYEHALVRAQQIALSYGILYRLWDLGSGMGTVDAADRAYQEGLEDHRFAPRPALTGTAVAQETGQAPMLRQPVAPGQEPVLP